jgi:hypothetical protein
MGKQLAHRGGAMLFGQVRQPFRDWRIQVEHAATYELGGSRRGEWLGHRAEPECVLRGSRDIKFQIRLAVSLGPYEFARPRHRE